LITFSATVPSPSTVIVKGYFFFTKFAVTVLLEFITTLVVAVVPVAPVQLEKRYSPAGVAVILTVAPSVYCPVVGATVPPAVGLAAVVKVYFTGGGAGSSSALEEQDTTNKTDNSKRNFLTTLI
jgi:hypothetical protein